MKLVISFLLIATLISGVLADYECSEASYIQYLNDYGKQQRLKLPDLKPYLSAFCQSLKNVTLKNDKCKCDSSTINQFSDMLESQRSNFLSAKRPTDSSPYRVQMSPQKTMGSLWVAGGAPPNWRAQNKVSRIKDQGSCGSCWAHTGIGLYESYLMVKGKVQYDLSEQFLLECTTSLIPNGMTSSCAGGYTDFAIQVAQKFGVPEQTVWPYKGSTFGSIASVPSSPGICSTTQTLIKYDNMPGVKNVTTVKRYDNTTNAEIETLLAEGPVGALMFVDASLQAHRGPSVYTGCPAFANAFAGINHAVVIVGMDANKNYIIKNSWGTLWGDNGFATIDFNNDCALSAYVYAISWGYQLIGSAMLVFFALISLMF